MKKDRKIASDLKKEFQLIQIFTFVYIKTKYIYDLIYYILNIRLGLIFLFLYIMCIVCI